MRDEDEELGLMEGVSFRRRRKREGGSGKECNNQHTGCKCYASVMFPS